MSSAIKSEPIWTIEALQAFEVEVAEAFARSEIRGPIHLSGGNEDMLLAIFQDIAPDDWVFSTWRNHYHALLHGMPREEVMRQILAGRSMNLNSPAHRFYTSAIVGGILPIAVGVAEAIRRLHLPRQVWCFVGDMAASTGAFQDAVNLAGGLPITFIVEDNGLSTNTPTADCWKPTGRQRQYRYARRYPHTGVGQWVQF